MVPRFAVYFSPADDSALARFGETVLSRTPTEVPALGATESANWGDLLSRPRHYGFHATLKAPFELVEGSSEKELMDGVSRLASSMDSCTLDGLRVTEFNGFAALAFDQQPETLASVARQCVLQLEHFRAPLTEADYQRRDPDNLSARQRSNLREFGYHHILEDFDFHMTLSGPLGDRKQAFLDHLGTQFEQLVVTPQRFDRLCVYHQSDRSQAFLRVGEFPFADVEKRELLSGEPAGQRDTGS